MAKKVISLKFMNLVKPIPKENHVSAEKRLDIAKIIKHINIPEEPQTFYDEILGKTTSEKAARQVTKN